MDKNKTTSFSLKAAVQKCIGKGRWHFIHLDKKMSQKVKLLNKKKMSWGYVPIKATIGKSTWKTTLFPTKKDVYMLALKADVRKKEDLKIGDMIKVSFSIN